MFSFNPQFRSPEVVLEKHISVKAAAECSGYSVQYLRRLLRDGRLEGTKIGQVWLIKLASFESYLRHGQMLCDRRHGPRKLASGGAPGVREDAAQHLAIPAIRLVFQQPGQDQTAAPARDRHSCHLVAAARLGHTRATVVWA